MPLSRSFKETVKERIDQDPAFRDALLAEGVDALLSGEVDVGKIILRDCSQLAQGGLTASSREGR